MQPPYLHPVARVRLGHALGLYTTDSVLQLSELRSGNFGPTSLTDHNLGLVFCSLQKRKSASGRLPGFGLNIFVSIEFSCKFTDHFSGPASALGPLCVCYFLAR